MVTLLEKRARQSEASNSGQQLIQPMSRLGCDASKDVGEPACGSTPFILAVTTRLYMAAARRPPRSEPQKSQDFRPRAIARSFCPCRAGIGISLPLASLVWLQGPHPTGAGVG